MSVPVDGDCFDFTLRPTVAEPDCVIACPASHWVDVSKCNAEFRDRRELGRLLCCDVFASRDIQVVDWLDWGRSRCAIGSRSMDDIRKRVFFQCHDCGNLRWFFATKSPQSVFELVDRLNIGMGESLAGFFPGAWFGAIIECQSDFDERYPALMRLPVDKRFLMVEPVRGRVRLNLVGIDWVVVGGDCLERETDVHDVIAVAQQCELAGVPCFIRQFGSRPVLGNREEDKHFETRFWVNKDMVSGSWRIKLRNSIGCDPSEWPDWLRVFRQLPVVA